MASQVFFRFKNAISQEAVSFDGAVVRIGDVKRLIAVKRGLGEEGAAELTLFDSSTNDEYADDAKVIPRNTLVIVKRAPPTKYKPLQSAAATAPAAAAAPPAQQPQQGANGAAGADAAAQPGGEEFGGDYFSEQPQQAVVGEDESKALQSLVQGTAERWRGEVRRGASRGWGRGRGGRGMVPLDHRCWRCVLTARAQRGGQERPRQQRCAGLLQLHVPVGPPSCRPPNHRPPRHPPPAPQVRRRRAALGAGLPHPGRPRL